MPNIVVFRLIHGGIPPELRYSLLLCRIPSIFFLIIILWYSALFCGIPSYFVVFRLILWYTCEAVGRPARFSAFHAL